MKFGGFILVLMVLSGFGGCWINQELTAMHTSATKGPEWFAAVCTPENNPQYDCSAVLQTKWAVISIGEPDPETGEQGGIPVALLGWYYFTVISVWYLIIGVPSYARRFWHYALLLGISVGCAVSVFYLYILFAEMDQKCIWCMVSHGLNFILLGGTILLRPKKPAMANAADDYQAMPAVALARAYPGARLVMATLLCAAALMAAESAIVLNSKNKRLVTMYEEEMSKIHADTASQLAQFEAQKPVTIMVRNNDPQQAQGTGLLPLVVFSDFQCPSCRKFALDLEKKINPEFDNLLRVIWKHLPGCTECNPTAKRNLHPSACQAAYAAEAARIQGGNEAFWKAHDLLFSIAAGRQLSKVDYRQFATALKLEPEQFISDMQSEAVKKRVLEDIEQAKALGVTGTPGIFLGGRKTPQYALHNRPFMDAIKKYVIAQREAAAKKAEDKKPDPSTPVPPDPTPGNPNPPTAP